MPGGIGIGMALRMTRLAGLLMFSNVLASDIADGSTNHGFLSKYLQLRSESSKSFIGGNGKFMAHHLNRMEHGGRPEASSDQYGLVEDASAPFGTSKNFKPQNIADNKDDTDVQKLLSNESNKPIGFSAIAVAVALLSVAAMVGVRIRRRMQPAIALAGSSGNGMDQSFRESELQQGQDVTGAVFFVSAAAAGSTKVGDVPPHLTAGDRVRPAVTALQLPSLRSARRPTALRAETGAVSAQDRTDALIKELADTEVFNLPAKVRQEAILRQVGRPQFFLRIAELCDDAGGEEREKLTALADNLAKTLAVVIESAEQKMDDAAAMLQEVVVSCAEPDGEFLVPLSSERFGSLQTAVWTKMEAGEFGEGALSTVDAWAKKAQDDGLDGMVAILRKVLQLFASRVLRFDAVLAAQQLAEMMPPDAAEKIDTSGDTPKLHPDYAAAADLYEELLAGDAEAWPRLLSERLNGDNAVKKQNVLAIVQAQIERVVLLQENGSFTQRVSAEFLRELTQQVEQHAPKSDDDEFDAAAFVREQIMGDDAN